MSQLKEYTDFKKSLLPLEKMKKISEAESYKIYQNNKPFPHIVLDNFFDEVILDKILEEFPSKDEIDWQKYESYFEIKFASKSEEQLPLFTRYFLYNLNSSAFINFLEDLTGIHHLIPDPHLEGGGLHHILPGGKLCIHADFNKFARLKLDRRLNLLIYLNKDWQEEYGGYLELWDKDMKNCIRKILPVFNRMVIFSTTDFSFHGHPEPLTCPPDRSRKSIALYYYSNGRPAEEISESHNTIFKLKPGEIQK